MTWIAVGVDCFNDGCRNNSYTMTLPCQYFLPILNTLVTASSAQAESSSRKHPHPLRLLRPVTFPCFPRLLAYDHLSQSCVHRLCLSLLPDPILDCSFQVQAKKPHTSMYGHSAIRERTISPRF